MSFPVVVLEDVARKLHMRRRFRSLPSATSKVNTSKWAWYVTWLRS